MGRPYLYGLAAGQAGVEAAGFESKRNMMLMGINKLSQLDTLKSAEDSSV